jgi:hypothetical protein
MSTCDPIYTKLASPYSKVASPYSKLCAPEPPTAISMIFQDGTLALFQDGSQIIYN